jgi:hypothetical protein
MEEHLSPECALHYRRSLRSDERRSQCESLPARDEMGSDALPAERALHAGPLRSRAGEARWLADEDLPRGLSAAAGDVYPRALPAALPANPLVR